MSIRSMTAYASGERNTPWGTLGCELRAVNHRFLELGVRLPDELRALEPALRERVSTRVSRGKLDPKPLATDLISRGLEVKDAVLAKADAVREDVEDMVAEARAASEQRKAHPEEA